MNAATSTVAGVGDRTDAVAPEGERWETHTGKLTKSSNKVDRISSVAVSTARPSVALVARTDGSPVHHGACALAVAGHARTGFVHEAVANAIDVVAQ